jgi:Ca2+-transporting ATPase
LRGCGGGDESILTGESLPLDKSAGNGETARVFSGSLLVRGFGVAQVQATGVRSEIGRIGHALTTLTDETTALFREVRNIVRWVALSAVLLCAAIAVIYAAARSDWLGGVLAGITQFAQPSLAAVLAVVVASVSLVLTSGVLLRNKQVAC